VKNGIKDWSYYSLSLRQDLGGRTSAWVVYDYIPAFYLRHYRDDDWTKQFGYVPSSFQSFDYKKDEIGVWLQRAFWKSTRVRVFGSYARYFYNQHFAEYDCINRVLRVEMWQTILPNVRAIAGYSFTSSCAKGNADTDPTYKEDTYLLGAEWELPRVFGRANSVEVEGEYSRRCYTTRHFLELDPLHAGRRDDEYVLSVKYSISLQRRIVLALTYGWHRRDARTFALQNAAYLSAEKDYRQYQIGLEAKYTLNFFTADDSEFEGKQ
jgi:hypothetical protein